ncbi:hypothetical protein FVEN_g3777 [Fusarium venenatum]|uniref:uncharacterized protein n=1 Tax=Fusarium venenatum TaxID=56646 RepID=UPI001D99BE37|nr:hypothetical protein FVEN_g3777 [Fusarium venenatum]KAH6980257.1 hypothetical protein EDB82DRAFT_539884 [Fusarium venenatum]
MKYASFLAALAATSAAAMPNSLHKRECHGSGETWGAEKFKAIQTVQELCDGQINGPFNTNGQYIRRCVNLSSNKKMDLFVRYDEGQFDGVTRYIDKEDCVGYLQREINGCEHGGRTTYERTVTPGKVTVSADPNSGNCA